MNKIFIHTNDKQYFGAVLGKFSIEKHHPNANFTVDILNMENHSSFNSLFNEKIIMGGREVTYKKQDLQSFTLSRFMPPSLMGYDGRSLVIDPDIFCVRQGLDELFHLNLNGQSIAAVEKDHKFLSSGMLLENSRLKHWDIDKIINDLINKRNDYRYYMNLDFEKGNILEIHQQYNSLDYIDKSTVLLHNTNRLTQPWKTGLKIDFTPTPMKKIFGIIPREAIHFLLGKTPKYFTNHPDPKQIKFFLTLCRQAMQENVIDKYFMEEQIQLNNIRPDIIQLIENA